MKRFWDIPAILFLAAALFVSVERLTATKWTLYLDIPEFLVLVGLLLGILLGKSRFSGRTVGWFGFLYTIFIVPHQVAATMSNEIPWLERYISVGGRLNAILYTLLHNQPVQDNLLFIVLMALLYWLLALTSAYRLVRYGRPWVPLLIAGAALIIIDQYSTFLLHRDRYLAVYFLCLLCLVGRLYYLHSRNTWIEKGYTIDSETGFSLGRVMLIGGLALVLLSWNLPVFADTGANKDMRDRVSSAFSTLRSRLSNAMAGLRNPVSYVGDAYGGTLGLGTNAVQGDDVVFRVTIASLGQEDLRYYWKGSSWDRYDGRQWSSSVSRRDAVNPNEWPIDPGVWFGRIKVNLDFEIVGGVMQKIYVPNMPEYVSRPVDAVADPQRDGQNLDLDLVSLLAKPVLHAGDHLRAETSLSVPTIAQLRDAPLNYPQWVKDRYLQLPNHFSSAIQAKAKELTAGQETNYDKAQAITQYLRDTITYEKSIPEPPAGRDPIEWFLFDYKKGFCNYYATAEVLMLRSVGIPARLVTGYAQGEYNVQTRAFEVRTRDSHAWPEVYFPGYGWVEFEPTAGQPERVLAAGVDLANSSNDPNNPSAGDLGDNQRPANDKNKMEEADVPAYPIQTAAQRSLPIAAGAGAVLVLSGVVGFILWKRPKLHLKPLPVWLEERYQKQGFETPQVIQRWAGFARLSPVERLYLGVTWMLWLRRKPILNGGTPAERIAEATDGIPEAIVPGQIFLEEYQYAIFSQHPHDLTRARRAYTQLWLRITTFLTRHLLQNPTEN